MGKFEQVMRLISEGYLDFVGVEEGKGYLPQKYLEQRAFVEVAGDLVKIHYKTTPQNTYDHHTVQVWKKAEGFC